MNNKRKTRGGGGGGSRGGERPAAMRSNSTKTPDREARSENSHGKEECEGVYKNARFTHTVTSLIGNTLRVETQNNIEFEGILKTFSPQLEMVLEWVHQVDPTMADCINHETVKEKMVFPMKDIVQYYAIDVDLNFATKEEFQTDTQISNKFNGEAPMRELEQWMPDAGEDDMVDLGEMGNTSSNGWSAHEMFAKNKEFGVETSYDPNLSGYTTQLNKNSENSAEWRERERRAAAIAAEIEGNTHSIAAVELENGDEEEAFSAVVRDKASPGGADKPYVPPGRRDTGGRGGSRGAGGGRGARGTPPGNDDYRGGNRYNNDRGYSRGGYNNDRGDRYDRGGQGGYNNDYRSDRYNRDNRDRGYNKRDDKKSSPIPEHDRADRRKSGEQQQRSPGVNDSDSGHRLAKNKSREQQSSELKEFQDNFQLSTGGSPGGPAKSPVSSTTPRVSVKLGPGGSQQTTPLPSPGHQEAAPAGGPQEVMSPDPTSSPPAASSTLSDSVKKSTLNPNAKEFSLNPSAKEFTPRAPTRVNPTPPRPQTPNTPNSMAGMGGMQPIFTSQGGYIIQAPGQMGMAPNGMFVQTAGHPPHMIQAGGQPMVTSIAGVAGQFAHGAVNPGAAPYMQQNTRHNTPQGGPRGQGGKDGGNGARPDLPSPLQVTGHPILAGPVPGHQHQFMTAAAAGYPPHQQHMYPGQPHGQPQMVRMIVPGPGMMPGMLSGQPADNSGGGGQPGQQQPMWAGQPGQAGQPPPPTPPQHGTQPNTPAPSPGLPQHMYTTSGPHGHAQPPSYPPGQPGAGQQLVVIPHHGAFPHGIPTSVGSHGHMPGQPMMVGGQQPVTSMPPHFTHYMPAHQGQPNMAAHLMQPQHNQQ